MKVWKSKNIIYLKWLMQIQNSTNTMKEKEIRAQINRISEQINIQKIYYSIKKINIMNYLKKENILKI